MGWERVLVTGGGGGECGVCTGTLVQCERAVRLSWEGVEDEALVYK
jgi:hypothetical protein